MHYLTLVRDIWIKNESQRNKRFTKNKILSLLCGWSFHFINSMVKSVFHFEFCNLCLYPVKNLFVFQLRCSYFWLCFGLNLTTKWQSHSVDHQCQLIVLILFPEKSRLLHLVLSKNKFQNRDPRRLTCNIS